MHRPAMLAPHLAFRYATISISPYANFRKSPGFTLEVEINARIAEMNCLSGNLPKVAHDHLGLVYEAIDVISPPLEHSPPLLCKFS